jgi:hypothetical protein
MVPAPMEPLAGTATWWHLEDRFSLHGLALRLLDPDQGEKADDLQVNIPGVAFHGPFSEDFAWVHLEDWPHGPIHLTEAQAHLFSALWKHRSHPQSAEYLMREAGLASERPIDVFKLKASNRGDPRYEGPLHAYEKLVIRQRRQGLYQLLL